MNHTILGIHKIIGSNLFDLMLLDCNFENKLFTFMYKGKSKNHSRIFNMISKRLNTNYNFERLNIYQFSLRGLINVNGIGDNQILEIKLNK